MILQTRFCKKTCKNASYDVRKPRFVDKPSLWIWANGFYNFVQVTFICACSDCIYELVYSYSTVFQLHYCHTLYSFMHLPTRSLCCLLILYAWLPFPALAITCTFSSLIHSLHLSPLIYLARSPHWFLLSHDFSRDAKFKDQQCVTFAWFGARGYTTHIRYSVFSKSSARIVRESISRPSKCVILGSSAFPWLVYFVMMPDLYFGILKLVLFRPSSSEVIIIYCPDQLDFEAAWCLMIDFPRLINTVIEYGLKGFMRVLA